MRSRLAHIAIGAHALLGLYGCWLLDERSGRAPRPDAGAADASPPDPSDGGPSADAWVPSDARPAPDVGPAPPPPPLPCFAGDTVIASLDAETRATVTDLVAHDDDWIAVYRTERDFSSRRYFVAFVGADGAVRHTQEPSPTDGEWIAEGGLFELRSPGGRSALVSTRGWRPVDVVGDELVRRLDGFADGHVGFPVLAWSAPAGGPIHVLSWVPDGTDAGTYRARSAVVSLTDDGTIAVRSRFVVLGLDVWLHYYGGHLQGDHLNVAEFVHVDVEGRRSWNIIDVRLDVEGDGDELGWELLGERPVDGPESFVGFLPELDRALAIRQERVGGVPSGPPSVVSEALPSPIAGPPARLVEGESPTIVARDDSTLVLVTYSAVHAFALPAQELVAREELEGARAFPSRGRLLALGQAPRDDGGTDVVLRCRELR